MHINGLYSKYPEYTGFPRYYQKAKDNYIWINGKKYLDMSYSGLGTNILGYANKEVNRAVKKVIDDGSMSTINHEKEQELSEILLFNNPQFDITRFFKSGGEAVSWVLQLFHDKNRPVLQCGYNGWHAEHINRVSFEYNDTDDFLEKIKLNPSCVIIEPIRNRKPNWGFFTSIIEKCNELNIPLIFDEITSGFRFHNGGFYLYFDMHPDIVIFGKAISNGYPLSVVLLKDKYNEQIKNTFCSSTYFTDSIGVTAAIETMRQLSIQQFSYLYNLGYEIMQIWKAISLFYILPIEVNEIPQLAHFDFIGEKRKEYRSIFVETFLEYGILANTSFYPNFAHTFYDLKKYSNVCNIAFRRIAENKDNPERIIRGSIIQDRPIIIK